MVDFSFFCGLRTWWRDSVRALGLPQATRKFFSEFWEFLRDSTPSRRRQRFGDIGFDLDWTRPARVCRSGRVCAAWSPARISRLSRNCSTKSCSG
jgi:hypothetical protein